MIYNFLKVLSTEMIKGATVAHCKCLLCGKLCSKRMAAVKFGHVKSCGCLNKLVITGSKTALINRLDDFNSEEVNYWGGFLFGDGCIDKKGTLQVCLTTNQNCPQYLSKLSNLIFGKNLVKSYPEKTKCTLRVADKQLVNNLSKFGIIKNKTYNATIRIPNKKMAQHVIRGYFDADGWFSESNTVVKNKNYKGYCLGLCSYLSENLEVVKLYLPVQVNINKCKRKSQLYEIRLSDRNKINEVINYLSPVNRNLILDYKWEKIWKFQNQYYHTSVQPDTKN